MRVAFLHVGDDLTLPTLMVESVRKHMPNLGIVQMTDAETPDVPGVDVRVELPYRDEGFMVYRLDHLSRLEHDTIHLDTDVIVQADLTHVFECPWDVALTRRTAPILLHGKDIVGDQPYNTGVMFSRHPAFWQDALDDCRQRNESERRWFGDQLSIAAIAKTGKYKVAQLPCAIYNHSPEAWDEDVSLCAVVHYKGKRKPWMVNRGRMAMAARPTTEALG